MYSLIKLFRDGSIETINLEKISDINGLSIHLNNQQTNIEELQILNLQEYNLKIFGSDNKHLLKENKHELPSETDRIYYGDLLVAKYNLNNKIDNLTLKEYSQLFLEEDMFS